MTTTEADYARAASDPAVRFEAMRQLRDNGYVVIRAGSSAPVGIEAVAGVVGPLVESTYGTIWDLIPEDHPTVIGNTNEHVYPHTDEAYLHSPPGIRVLYCVKPAEDGGDNILVDGFLVAQALRSSEPKTFALLAREPQQFRRVVREDGIDQRTSARVLVTDAAGVLRGVRFQPRSAGPADLESDFGRQLADANSTFEQMTLEVEYEIDLRLEAGDAVLFDNHRMLHARQSFFDRSRHQQISTISRESFHQALRLAAYELGFTEEAEATLGSGAVAS